MVQENMHPGVAHSMRWPHEACRRCGALRCDEPLASNRTLGALVWTCVDVPACHGRMMRPKLRVLPGGARY